MFQQQPKTFPDDLVVFSEQDRDFFHDLSFVFLLNGICAQTVVPLPGVDSTLNLPLTISTRSLMPSSPRRLLFLPCGNRSARKPWPLSSTFMQMLPSSFSMF